MNILELDNEIKEVLQEQEGLPWGTNQCLLYKAQIMLRTIPALEAEIEKLKLNSIGHSERSGYLSRLKVCGEIITEQQDEIEMQTDISNAFGQSNKDKDAFIQALMGEIEDLKAELNKFKPKEDSNKTLTLNFAKEFFK